MGMVLPFLSTLEQLAVGAAEFKSWKLAQVVGPSAELYLQQNIILSASAQNLFGVARSSPAVLTDLLEE